MGIFGRLFKKKPEIELDDPVFGHLAFDQGIWTFIPCADEGLMVTVAAPGTGPTAGQRDLFQRIRARLADFERRARDYMRSRVDETVDVARLSVYSVEIGSAEETGRREFVLELSDADAFVIHRVSFRGDEAVGYTFDD
jgi:hypothetical protein